MKIAIIGAGNVGGALGANWAGKGHDIFFGVRDPKAEKTQGLLAQDRRQGARRQPGRGGGFRRCDRAVDAVAGDRGRHPLDGRPQGQDRARRHQPADARAGRHQPGDRPYHLRRRESARLGGRRLGVQDAQHHRLRQYGEPGLQRREIDDVRRRRRRRQQAESDRSRRRARLRRDRRRSAAQCAPAGSARHAVDRSCRSRAASAPTGHLRV